MADPAELESLDRPVPFPEGGDQVEDCRKPPGLISRSLFVPSLPCVLPVLGQLNSSTLGRHHELDVQASRIQKLFRIGSSDLHTPADDASLAHERNLQRDQLNLPSFACKAGVAHGI